MGDRPAADRPPAARPVVGLIVNPVAGLGGTVGLKGSDTLDVQRTALAAGAIPNAGERAFHALRPLRPLRDEIEILTVGGDMGEAAARRAGFDPRIVDCAAATPSSGEDTRRAARAMADEGVSLLLFTGGDGTAIDVLAAVGDDQPCLGIPAGVKMHSGVFGLTPSRAGELALRYLTGSARPLAPAEVMDVDEDEFRIGAVSPLHHGYLLVPRSRDLVQDVKARSQLSEEAAQLAAAQGVVDRVPPEAVLVVGPGPTTAAVVRLLGLEPGLTGVDIVSAGRLLVRDADEAAILAAMNGEQPVIVVTPVGGQGFLFGRGNQQISSRVLALAGRDRILPVATASKLAALGGRPLRVDTGDDQVDRMLSGHIRIVTGVATECIYRVEA
jgi:predicted polyphosphate/ATP-dependent NAD kinase